MKKNEVRTITPPPSVQTINLKELHRFRNLLYTLALRDIKVRYKQTIIGGFWAILQPFSTMIVFTLFFGEVAKISTDGAPYAIFSYSGLLIWNYFSTAISSTSNSLVGNKSLVTKVYFPREILPLSKTFVGLLDYCIALIIAFGLMIYFNYPFTLALLVLPITIFGTWLLASGIGLWSSAINIKYRDVRFAIPFFIRLLMFLTPVIYPSSLAGKYTWLLKLNPLSGFVEAHRAGIITTNSIPWPDLRLSFGLTFIIFITGSIYFKSVEKYFADLI